MYLQNMCYKHMLDKVRYFIEKVRLGKVWRIDNMEAASLPSERTDLVSTNRLGYGWAYQKLANQQAIFRTGCKDGRLNQLFVV